MNAEPGDDADPVEPVIKADAVAQRLAPDGVVKDIAVTFRGWLSAGNDGSPLPGDVYRLYTSWFDGWLEIKSGDLLYQLPGSETRDGASIIWVKHDATVAKCEAGEARHFAEQELELGVDPTSVNRSAASYPRH